MARVGLREGEGGGRRIRGGLVVIYWAKFLYGFNI